MKYLILGAGPAGLSFANRLKQKGITNFLILEKEKTAGGLCRSVDVDGSPFDIGGGHFLDVRRPKVNEFLFDFMPENEWNKYERDSRIVINDNVINHPIEANIWQMDVKNQVEYLKSIAIAGCNIGTSMPDTFVDWIYWKLGSKIAEDYMIPYNQKMFNKELNQLGTYWLEKLPNVSFEETLLSCLTKKAYGRQPGHAQFYYPKKYGYGDITENQFTQIVDVHGGRPEPITIRYVYKLNKPINEILEELRREAGVEEGEAFGKDFIFSAWITDKTKDIDIQIDDAIDEATDKIAGKDFTPISFASDENTDIGLVQFAMKTEAISIDDDDDEEETVEGNKSFVQKLKDLF